MSAEQAPYWLSGRTLDYLVECCRRDHRAPLADLAPGDRARIVEAPQRLYRAGEKSLGRLGGALFAAIAGDPDPGGGRALLAALATLVFWECNEVPVRLRPGLLVDRVRRAAGSGHARDRIAALAIKDFRLAADPLPPTMRVPAAKGRGTDRLEESDA